MVESSAACPREGESPDGAPGPVSDIETMLRTVPVYEQLIFSPDGQPSLPLTFFSQEELAGRRGKTVSVLREEATPNDEVTRRCKYLNKDEYWKGDPVVARATAQMLRQIVDAEGEREVCVNADPTDDSNDRLGACPTHASILRATERRRKVPPRLEWGIVRARLASCFSGIRHLSGTVPTVRD